MRCAAAQQWWVCPDWTCLELVQVEMLVLAAADTECTAAQLVVLESAEVDYYLTSPLKFTVEEGAMVSLAVAGVWAVGWVIRQLIGMVRERPDPVNEE